MGLFDKLKKSPDDTSGVGLTSDSIPNNEEQPRKKSLYQKYQDLKRGPGTSQMSDEDLKKYTGMDRAEFDKYSATTPGVAGGQAAGSLTAGGNSGLGGTAAADGLGGWVRHPTSSTRLPNANDNRDSKLGRDLLKDNFDKCLVPSYQYVWSGSGQAKPIGVI